jgi:membrane-bound lytic murein transglycosylase C
MSLKTNNQSNNCYSSKSKLLMIITTMFLLSNNAIAVQIDNNLNLNQNFTSTEQQLNHNKKNSNLKKDNNINHDDLNKINDNSNNSQITQINQLYDFIKLENYIVNKYKNISNTDARNIVKTSYQYAQKRNLEHTLVLAIIEGESNFNKSIKSSANAVGLMQVIPKYHQETIKKAVNENTTTKSNSIYDIENNIASGTNIIRQYINKYKNIPRALQAYRGQHNNMQYAKKILNFQQEIKNHLLKI